MHKKHFRENVLAWYTDWAVYGKWLDWLGLYLLGLRKNKILKGLDRVDVDTMFHVSIY